MAYLGFYFGRGEGGLKYFGKVGVFNNNNNNNTLFQTIVHMDNKKK